MLLTVLIILSLFSLIATHRARYTVSVINGQCILRGKRLDRGISYDEENCKELHCQIRNEGMRGGHVEIIGCTNDEVLMDDGSVCTFKQVKGTFPVCCHGERQCSDK
uniref:Venom protein n=1 Tax=Hadrurus spadix TaxID=141984 RepID=A0A1W7R9A9_9SCOR